MRCDEARELIWPDLDCELDMDQQAKLHHHISGCADCLLVQRDTGRLRNKLRIESGTDEGSPVEVEALWRNISDALDDHDAENYRDQPDPAPLKRPVFGRRAFLAASGVAAGVVTGFVGFRQFLSGSPDVVGEAVTDFLTFRAGGMTLNVVNSNPEPLKRWLTERVSFDIAINAGPPQGFSLVGGRLCSFLNRRLVFIYYEKGSAGVSLYLMSSEGLRVPDDNLVQAGDRQVSASSVNGVAAATWQSDGLVFAAVSDLPADELLEFIAAI